MAILNNQPVSLDAIAAEYGLQPGTTISLDNIAAIVGNAPKQPTNFASVRNRNLCSGGTIQYATSSNGITYAIHTFTASGVFTVPFANLICEVLVVAGGGGSSYYVNGQGGAGGGGVIHHTRFNTSGNIAVIVGAGGAVGSVGNDSYFGPMRAFGGGAMNGSQNNLDRAGGSGGGAGHMNPSGTGGPTIQTSNNGGIGYGNIGGNQVYASPYWNGSGGGAGTAGGYAANGGDGKAFQISAEATRGDTIVDLPRGTAFVGLNYYAGGGGQININGSATLGGLGGGADGTVAGTGQGRVNSGGGGGAVKQAAANNIGGSGIVIIKYRVTARP